MLNKKILLALVLYLGVLSPAAQAEGDVAELKLESLPGWAQDSLYSGTYLNIDKVMKAEGLSRFAAVELQNRFRDISQKDPQPTQQMDYEKALQLTTAGSFESGRSVLFSAKLDDALQDIVKRWKFSDGTPATLHLDGVFSRNHLVLEKKALVPRKVPI